MIKGIGVNPIGQEQFTDHLAPICTIMDIPLLFHDEAEESAAKHYYPDLKTLFLPFHEFNPEYLIKNYDATFLSDQWHRDSLRTKFAPLEKKYGKRLRNVHCPHGFSDKGFYLRGCAFEDIVLIYGQNMLDLLKEWGVLQDLGQYVVSGNYRLSYYRKHKKFFDQLVQEELLKNFSRRNKVLLYAPTCGDLEDSSSFFAAAQPLLDNLPDEYSMIVKLHPRLELDDPANFYRILGRYEGRSNILFIRRFHLIYPLLALCGLYIGDMSSIGYDFLTFNRPMFFLNQQRRDPAHDRGLYLFRCGTEVLPEHYANIYSIIREALPTDEEKYSALRQEVYDYTFGSERAFDEIKADIVKEILKKDSF